MKAKDIVAGAEYLSCAVRDWQANTYTGMGHGSVQRVRVIDPVPGPWNSASGEYVKREGYSYQTTVGVLVELLNPESGEVMRRSVVTTASLRGPWKQTWDSVQENSRRNAQAREERRTELHAARLRVQEALSTLGDLAGFHTGAYVQDEWRAVINVEVLERIIERLREVR